MEMGAVLSLPPMPLSIGKLYASEPMRSALSKLAEEKQEGKLDLQQ